MKPFLKRLTLIACTGYIIMYFGELVFWATPDREGMNIAGIIPMWILYSLMAYPLLCVVSLFKVRDPWAVFLAGAFYGWFEEGVILQTTYGVPATPFPMSISFTALAWHAPIGVWVGWYLLRKVLSENKYMKTLRLAGGIGLFFGLWAVFWFNEPPAPMKLLLDAGRQDLVFIHFVGYAFISTVVLILVYWLYQRVIGEFRTSRLELWILGLLSLAYYVFVTVPAAPKALWVLPPLLALTFWALWRNRQREVRENVITAFSNRVRRRNYLLLLMIPLVASIIYFVFLATNIRLPINLIFYYIATPSGFILWVLSLVLLLRRSKV